MNKQPHGTRKMLPCPRCGELPGDCTCKSKAVKATTVKALVTEEALARVGLTEGFRFCFETDCDIVYFNPETGDRYLRQDVRVRVGQKETRPPRLVCYCFNHTVEDIEADVAQTGTSDIPDEITKQCRAGLDRCEVTNPQGSCCLGNVRKALTEAQAKFGEVPTGTGGNASSCCCESPKTAGGDKGRAANSRAGLVATGGSVGVALLPTLTCPACWPGYAAILSSFGIGFIPSNRILLPLTVIFLTFYLGVLAWDARKCRRVGPLILGVVASVVLISGRFVIASDAVLYAGIGLLMTASAWNVWSAKKRMRLAARCPACETGDETQTTTS